MVHMHIKSWESQSQSEPGVLTLEYCVYVCVEVGSIKKHRFPTSAFLTEILCYKLEYYFWFSSLQLHAWFECNEFIFIMRKISLRKKWQKVNSEEMRGCSHLDSRS